MWVMLMTSSVVKSRTYLAGLPPHSWPKGISCPASTTEQGRKLKLNAKFESS
jgi:hypothetical protein